MGFVRTFAAAGGAALVAVMLASGIASAEKDPLIGKTYAVALEKVSNWKATPVVSTVVGDRLPTDQCIVTGWRRTSYVKHDNFDHEKQILFSLNCNEVLASATNPGGSLASEQGRAEKAVEEKAERINSKPKWCAENLDQCHSFCDKHAGMCSEEIMTILS